MASPTWLHFTEHEIVGPFVLPAAQTGIVPSSYSGSAPAIADATARGQYRPDQVYVMDSHGIDVRNIIGGGYSFASGSNVRAYEVEPDGPLEPDPDPSLRDHYLASRCCRRARVLRQVWPEPS